MKKETYVYPSTGARMKAEYKIFIVAFVFIVIADSIGQIQVPLGPGTLILFPIFYSLIMGVLAGPEVLKIFNQTADAFSLASDHQSDGSFQIQVIHLRAVHIGADKPQSFFL